MVQAVALLRAGGPGRDADLILLHQLRSGVLQRLAPYGKEIITSDFPAIDENTATQLSSGR
jgi:hypothetical protein